MPPRKRGPTPAGQPRKLSANTSSAAPDVYSTPARRRRIIADVARFLLRQYCTKACKNVLIFRRHTAAALRIQCGFRIYVAKKLYHQKRLTRWTRCAIAIQLVRRCCLARRELERLKELERLRRIHAAATVLQCWYRRLVAIKIVNILRERRRDWACRCIQRVHRGRAARLMYYALYELSQRLKRRRNAAALRIQCLVRVRAAVKHVQWRRRHARALRRIHIAVSLWWWRRQRRLLEECARSLLQRGVRGLLGRLYVRRLRGVLAERRRLEELHRRRECNDMARADINAPEPVGTVELRLELPGTLLRHMSSEGPSAVAKWAVQQNIFRVDNVVRLDTDASVIRLAHQSSDLPEVIPRLSFGDLINRVLEKVLDTPENSVVSAESSEPPRLLSVQRPEAVIADDVLAYIDTREESDAVHDWLDKKTPAANGSSVAGRINSHMSSRHANSASDSNEDKQSRYPSTDDVKLAIHHLDGFSNKWNRLYSFGSDVLTLNQNWSPPSYATKRSDRCTGIYVDSAAKQCTHRIMHKGVTTCDMCRRCRALNILNEKIGRRGEIAYCGKIKFDNTVYKSDAPLQIKVTIHTLKSIDLYQNKPNVVCCQGVDGSDKYFVEDKIVLIFAEGEDSVEMDALDFRVNNSLMKVSFYDRGLQLAAKPPVEVHTDIVDIIEDTETDLEEWCVSVQPKKINARPQTARVMHMLVVEEEIAEIIPYDNKATILQCMVRRRNARIRASELRFLNSQRNVICNVMYKRVILGRWRKAVRDVLYRGHVAAICLQRFARGRRGRRDTNDVRMEKNILLWDQAKSSLQSHAIDKCSLKKIENEHNTMNREEKYAALQEYAGTLNISYSSFEGMAPKGRKLEDDTEGCLRNFVLRQPTAGWSSDLLNILDAPPAMAGCVSSSHILLVPSDNFLGAADSTENSNHGQNCLDKFTVPFEVSSDSRTWAYPSLQYQKWENKRLLDDITTAIVNTTQESSRTDLANPDTKSDSRIPPSRKRGLPPTGGVSSSSSKRSGTATVDSALIEPPHAAQSIMTAIADNCTGLGNVCEAAFDQKYKYEDINREFIAQFGLTDQCLFTPPTEGPPVFTLPPSRGRTPPVPPNQSVDVAADASTPDSVSSPPPHTLAWSPDDSNSFIPTLFSRL